MLLAAWAFLPFPTPQLSSLKHHFLQEAFWIHWKELRIPPLPGHDHFRLFSPLFTPLGPDWPVGTLESLLYATLLGSARKP